MYIQRFNHDLDLTAIPAFKSLDAAIHDALESAATVYHLKVGDTLYHQGEAAHSFYIVMSGGLRLLEHSPEGQTVNIKVHGQGEIFGLLAVSGPYPRRSEARAMCESVIAAIGGDDARHLMHRHPALGVLVIDLLVAHIHHAHDRIRTLAADRVEQRLARTLMLYAEKFGVAQGDEISIDVSVSQQDLAQFTGTTVETINRTLKGWEGRGLVRRGRRHLDILDAVRLGDVAEVSEART